MTRGVKEKTHLDGYDCIVLIFNIIRDRCIYCNVIILYTNGPDLLLRNK